MNDFSNCLCGLKKDLMFQMLINVFIQFIDGHGLDMPEIIRLATLIHFGLT